MKLGFYGQVSAVCVLLFSVVIVIAYILQKYRTGALEPHISICDLDELHFHTSIFTSPLEVGNSQWVLSVTLASILIIRKYVFGPLAIKFFDTIDPIKQIKCANYMLELFSSSVCMVVISYYGFWDVFALSK